MFNLDFVQNRVDGLNESFFIERKRKHVAVKGDYPFDPETNIIFDKGDFITACKYMMDKEDIIKAAVMGQAGRGKTNPAIFFTLMLNTIEGVDYDLDRMMYVGEQTIPDRRRFFEIHPKKDNIIFEEAELMFVPNSRQLRMLKQTLASGRGMGFNYWAIFPTFTDVQTSIIDAHFNWLIMVIYRDEIFKRCLIRIQYKAMYSDPSFGGEWVDYPFPNALFWIAYAPNYLFDWWDMRKRDIYVNELGFGEIYDQQIKDRKMLSKKESGEKYWKDIKQIASNKRSLAVKTAMMLDIDVKYVDIKSVLQINDGAITTIKTALNMGRKLPRIKKVRGALDLRRKGEKKKQIFGD